MSKNPCPDFEFYKIMFSILFIRVYMHKVLTLLFWFAVQAYMQTIGAYTQPQGIEYISRHSINFYESLWQRHQQEVSHNLYPRSNTISMISDCSFEDPSSYGSAPGSPSIPALPTKRRVRTLTCLFRSSLFHTASVIYDIYVNNDFGKITLLHSVYSKG